ncbi:MAG: DUF1003 domain-containing protein [Chthonomonadales bacterium]
MDARKLLALPPSVEVLLKRRKPVINVHDAVCDELSPLDKLASKITQRVGTMGFFLIIFTWTILWTGYNILASTVPGLHWTAFDPFPAFVAYLLISNVIQILLMPLIMVGQNIQGAHSEKRAESDYEVNVKAEKEIEIILRHLEFQNAVLISMLEHLGISKDEAVKGLKDQGMADGSPTKIV